MPRIVTVAAAQLGPIQKADTRQAVVARMLDLMDQAKAKGADFIVYPELALTTFFPALVSRGSRRGRFLVREGDAERGHPAAVRAGREARHGDELRLCRADARRASLQHIDPGRPNGRHRRQVPQGAPARPRRIRSAAHPSAPGEALLRAGRPRLSRLALHGRHLRHVHLQRPALARGLSGDGPAGRRADRARLQHALGQLAEERGGAAAAHLPPQALAAGRRLSELDLGGGRGQGRRRGRPSHVRLPASSSIPTARSSPRRAPRRTS